MELALPLLGVAASVAVALLFAVAGIDKLRHRDLLPGVIANYRLLPDALVAPAAALLPGVELLVAAGLLLGFAPLAPLVAIALLLVFVRPGGISIAAAAHVGLRQSLGWGQVARNLVLATALLPALAAGRADLAWPMRRLGAVAGVAFYLLLLMFSALGALAASAAKQG